jgi:hypothetical protein
LEIYCKNARAVHFFSFEKAGGGQTALTQYTNNPAKPDRERQRERESSKSKKKFSKNIYTISPAFKEMTFARGKHLFMRWGETTANDMRIGFS